ncbi:hypothetical protein PIB30_040678 [Stylosanthes scabra]|uniref:TIR domain-containing protein n=1 Tax=Stylosanthes scabra TaxID=79078 RepID=A0ABU6QE26_9FABA|nr:hypothetical protein [Stylosanthes scabra]
MAGDGEASMSSLSEGMFDVFLSFRGKDTRNLFTDFLYLELKKHQKLKVFRDEPGLEPGDEIKATLMEAIKRSRMFIVVMSENYRRCSSTPTMEQNGEFSQFFYHVEPKEVRHQISEKSKEAMKNHERRVGVEKVKAWKLALSTLCGLSGLHIVVNKE